MVNVFQELRGDWTVQTVTFPLGIKGHPSEEKGFCSEKEKREERKRFQSWL